MQEFQSGDRMRQMTLPVLLLLLWIAQCSGTSSAADEEINLLRKQARVGSELMRDTFQRESRWLRVQQEYEKVYQLGGFAIKQTSAAQEVKNLAKKLNQVVGKKMQAIKESVKFAEHVALNYDINPAIRENEVSYIDAKRLEESDPRMEYERMFLQKVVKNRSSVHIPTETFNGDPDVLNAIAWSSELDNIFVDNMKKDPELLWQYFGSQAGFFRMFPALRWRLPKDMPDMYDVRRRPWYTQGSTSPKDMLFLIDTSGSMHGQALSLTKKAVTSLIDTLGENDFIAVAQYPGRPVSPDHASKPHLIIDQVRGSQKSNKTCFKTFVQATKRNKNRLFSQIGDLSAHGIVNFYEAIDFAYNLFDQFYNTSVNNHGAMCNSIIMIFTDGDVSDSVDSTRRLIQSWRNKSEVLNKIRIFTYSVGQHQNPIEPMLEFACSNRGYFAEIPAMGAVTKQVQTITTVLSRPMTMYEAEYFLWHNIYLDSLGLGLMTSLTMPVYNTSGNQSFLGLMGTDVTVKEMRAMVPHHKFGPSGYAFAINANGYIVFHPELRAQNGWLRDPPNVDLIEVEFDSEEKREVRRKIIETTGNVKATVSPYEETVNNFLKISDDVHTHRATRTYAFTNVNKTAFAISVVLPPKGNSYADFSHFLNVTLRGAPSSNDTAAQDVAFYVDVSDDKGVYPHKRVNFPSNKFGYLVSTKMPYCREYFIPLRRSYARYRSSGASQSSPSAGGTTVAPARSQPLEPSWEMSDSQQEGVVPPQSRRRRRSTSAHGSGVGSGEKPPLQPGLTSAPPTAPPPPPQHFQADGFEETERMRHAPADMTNLLATFMHNRSLCDNHWVRAVAIDMTLYEDLFSAVEVVGSSASSVFVTGLSGIMGVLPAAEIPRYESWRQGWFEGYYQRAFERPDLIFASVVPFKVGEVSRQATVQSDPTAFVAFGSGVDAGVTPGVSTTATLTTPTMVSAEQIKSSEPPPVTLFQAVTMANEFKVAVSGVTMSWKWISESIFNSTFGSLCNQQLANNTCYLLEDGGYIVSANEHFEVIGHFLGHVDKALMRHLTFNLSVFGSVQEYDYQGSCPKRHASHSAKSAATAAPTGLAAAALRLLSPALGCLATVGNPRHLLPVPVVLWLAHSALAQESTSSVNQNESCIKLGYRYYRDPQAQESFRSVDPLGRRVTVLFLDGTNLVLVAVSRPPVVTDPTLLATLASGSLDYDELRREPQEDPGPDICSMESRFRMRPSSCYNWHPREDTTDCGSGFAISPKPHLTYVSAAFAAAFISSLLK